MIQSVFVILPKADNACIFYGQLDENDELEDIGNILGTIVEYAQNLDDRQIKAIRLSEGKFAYGKFSEIYLIFKIQQSDDMDDIKEILTKMADGFLRDYKKELDSFSGDISVFEDFSDHIGDYILSKTNEETLAQKGQIASSQQEATATPKINKEVEQDKGIELKEKGEGQDETKKSARSLLRAPKPIEFVPEKIPEAVKERELGTYPLIPPEKREAYPDGVPDYMIDEVLWNESQAVMKEYTSEFVEGLIGKLRIFLSISIVHHYDIIIDFQEYPKKPQVEISPDIIEDTNKKLEEYSYILKNWDEKIPPHIIELVRELEKVLLKLKTENKLSPTSEMPETMLPELEPLEMLPPAPKNIQPEKIDSNEEIKSEPPLKAQPPPSNEVKKKDLKQEIPINALETSKIQGTAEPKKTVQAAEMKTKEEKEEAASKNVKKQKSKKELEKELKRKKKEEEEKRKREQKEKEKLEKLMRKKEKKEAKQILKESKEEAKKELKKL
ncbi:MAG: hypothetical protein ACTSXF_12150 [Promethearchaeota archaeon]